MSTQRENEQPRAAVDQAERLEWQSELDSALSNLDTRLEQPVKANQVERLVWQSGLDSALSDIDSRLEHPRRRVTDAAPKSPLPALGQKVEFTSELLDEIAWRVSQHLQRQQPMVADAPAEPPAAPAPPEPEPALRPGIVLVIRFRWPFIMFG